MIQDAIQKLVHRDGLTQQEAYDAMSEIMDGRATAVQIAAFLVALRLKGESVEEIVGCARVMREKATRVKVNRVSLIDTCGTGGDAAGTFNVSTASAIVASGAGCSVAKHGNRAVSSRCGSADVLSALGVNIEMSPREAELCLEEIGITFLYAPLLHGAMKYAAPVRKELGMRTIFNILGPLTNPAGAQRQLLGVYGPEWTGPVASVLGVLGSEHALVVHGEGGMDEISHSGDTQVSEWRNGEVRTYKISPGTYGIERGSVHQILGGSAEENAGIIREVLDGKDGAPRDVVLLNSGAAIVVAGLAGSLQEGIEMASYSIDSGAAKRKLRDLVEASQVDRHVS